MLSELAFVKMGGVESESLRLGTPSLEWNESDGSGGFDRT